MKFSKRATANFRSWIILAIAWSAQAGLCQAQYTSNSSYDGQTREQARLQLRADAEGYESSLGFIRNLVRFTSPSVVHIEARKASEEELQAQAFIEEAGSGVIVDLNGRLAVVTNRHVILNSKPSDIHIQLRNGEFFHPLEIRSDRDSDIAVMFIERSDLTPAEIGSEDVEVGDFVIAIGSPFGLNHSISQGIVSGKSRHDLDLGANGVRYQEFLQTDAAINPGNSGGPLVNMRGEVIGINTAIASNSGGSDGIGFAIPIGVVMQAAKELEEFGYVRRGFLGVSLDSRYNAKAASELGLQTIYGAKVSAITPGSPASSSDLQVGDVILRFDGQMVENDSHLVSQVSRTEIGRTVVLEVYRNGNFTSVNAVVRDRQEFQASK